MRNAVILAMQQRIRDKEAQERSEAASSRVRPADEHEEQGKPKMRRLCEVQPEATSTSGGSDATNALWHRRSFTEAMREAINNQQAITKRRRMACQQAKTHNSEEEQLASQTVRVPASGSEPSRLHSRDIAGRIRKGELHAINNILNVRPRN